MSVKKTLLMLTLNYILIFVWMFWFRMGVLSALIILPVTMVIAFFDTVLAEGRLSALLWCGNLLIATIAGIVLQAYLYARYTYDTETAMLRAVVEITVAIIIISVTAAISGKEAARLRRIRARKSNADRHTDDEDDEYPVRNERRRTMSLRSQEISDDEPDTDTFADEDTFDEDMFDEDKPRFRVIKK